MNEFPILGNDILTLIGLELDLHDIENYKLVCSRIYKICNSNSFWYNKLQRDYSNIDVSDVCYYKKLYYYLNQRIECKEYDNFGNKIYDEMRAYDYKKNIFRFFPNYPPNFYLPFTNIFKIEYKKIQQIYMNVKINKSSIEGKYGEIYKVVIKTNDPDNLFWDIQTFKGLAFASKARFIDGIIVINLQDTYDDAF